MERDARYCSCRLLLFSPDRGEKVESQMFYECSLSHNLPCALILSCVVLFTQSAKEEG